MGHRPPSTAGPTRTSTYRLPDSGRGETGGGHGLTFGKITMTVPEGILFDPDRWTSTPLLRRRRAPQAGYLEVGLIVFLALATALFFIWLALRGPVLLKQISSWRPMCSLVSCEPQPHREAQAQPEPKSQPQPQPLREARAQPEPRSQPQPQPQARAQTHPRPQPPQHPPLPHVVSGVVVGEWVHYSRPLREPQRRSPIECWRDRSIRGPCFE
jgi:hypothetical protein